MEYFKSTLLYLKNFLFRLENLFFLKIKKIFFILHLFTLIFLTAIFSSSFAAFIPFLPALHSHNEQKMFSRLSSFLDACDSITPEMKEKAIQKIIDFEKDFKITPTNEAKTLRNLFFAVQETFLKEYVLYASFFQTIEKGKYDCLTGSLLYAIFLEEMKQKGSFEYTYQLIQLPTHVFVKIKLTDKSEIIFESTSFEKGFIATPKAIEFYLQQQNQEAQKNLQEENTLVLTNKKLNNLLTFENAAALLYFNQAVLFFDQRKFGKTLIMAKKAFYLQKSEIFYKLIQLSLQELLKNNYITENEYKINTESFSFISN